MGRAADFGMTSLEALLFCREHNLGVRFESSGTVTVWGRFGAGRTQRRRKTFLEAVMAVRQAREAVQRA